MADEKTKKEPSGNVVLDKFKKDNQREDKWKKWRPIDDAVSAARKAYTGSQWCGCEGKNEEKTVSFDKALGDLIDVLQKMKDGEIKLGGLGDEKEGISILE